jgi:methylglutaconyl-CoA hydratase
MIACVEGAALGGGMEIALTADMIVAGKNAKFGLPETSLAIIPGAGGTQRLPRLIGSARAKELIFTARKIDAQTAYQYGIVQHVVEAGDAEKKAMEIAKEIANNGPLAVRAAKQSINKGTNLDITSAMEVEKTCYGTIIPTDDRLEGLAAFKEKRKPVYKGC